MEFKNGSSKLALYEKFYDYELEVKTQISSRAQLSLTILFALAGALFFFCSFIFEFSSLNLLHLYWGYLLFICLSLLALFFSIYYFIRAAHLNGYHTISLGEMADLEKEFIDYRRNMGWVGAEYMAEKDLEDEYLSLYSEFSDANKCENINRTVMLRKCNWSLIVALCLIGFTSALYLYLDSRFDTGPNVQKVQIVSDLSSHDVKDDQISCTESGEDKMSDEPKKKSSGSNAPQNSGKGVVIGQSPQKPKAKGIFAVDSADKKTK